MKKFPSLRSYLATMRPEDKTNLIVRILTAVILVLFLTFVFNFENLVALYVSIRDTRMDLQEIEQGDIGKIMDYTEWVDGKFSSSQSFSASLTPEEQAEALECLKAMTTDMYLVFDHSEKPRTCRIRLQNPTSLYFYPDCMAPQFRSFHLSSPQYEEAFARLLDLAERVRQRVPDAPSPTIC